MKKITNLFFITIILSLFCFCKQSVESNQKNKAESIPENMVLTYDVFPPTIKSEKPGALIMLHGLGSEEKDLRFLNKFLKKDIFVFYPRGPLGHTNGKFKWYDFQVGSKGGNFKQAESSKKTLITFIDQIVSKFNIDKERIILGGFSQGAVMSLNLGLTAPEKVKGIAVFSGMLMKEIKPLTANKKRLGGLSVFLAHGETDEIFPFELATQTEEFLAEAGANVTTAYDDSGHTISQNNFTLFNEWLNMRLKK